MYLVKTPFWLKWLYPGFIWNKSRSEKCIYLTFDDGPIPVVTPFVIKTLKTYEAKATFFCIGDNVARHPDIFSDLIRNRHLIGNHTYNHLKGWDTDDDVYLTNIIKCRKLLQSNLFRPPYGRIKKSQAKKLLARLPETKIVMWDVLSGDFDIQLSPQRCLENVLKHTENGSIVVFHDSLKAFERLKFVLPRALEQWQKDGYQFKTL